VTESSVSLELLAELTVAVEGATDRDGRLAARGTSAAAFDAATRHWLDRIAEAASRGDFELGHRWASLLVQARAAQRRAGKPDERKAPKISAPKSPLDATIPTSASSLAALAQKPVMPFVSAQPILQPPLAPPPPRRDAGGTAEHDAEDFKPRSLPFAGPSEDLTRRAEAFSLAQYARLLAEERVDPATAAQRRAGYGVEPALWTALETLWGARVRAQPVLRTRLEGQVARLVTKIRSGEI
jgi:hypothetical protein